MWPRPPTFPSRASPTPYRRVSSSAGEANSRLPTRPLCHLQLSRLHRRPGRRYPGTEADHRRHAEIEKRHPAISSTAWGSTISLRDASRQRRLAGRPEPAPYSIPDRGMYFHMILIITSPDDDAVGGLQT